MQLINLYVTQLDFVIFEILLLVRLICEHYDLLEEMKFLHTIIYIFILFKDKVLI